MRRVVLVAVIVGLLLVNLVSLPHQTVAQVRAPVQYAETVLDTVAAWEQGRRENILVTNNAGGEVRLENPANPGVYTSVISQTTTAFNAVGVRWVADAPTGTRIQLEVRTGPTADAMGAWQPVIGGDARSQDDDAQTTEAVLAVAPDSTAVQMRATLTSAAANASPVISAFTLTTINSLRGPALSPGIPRVPAISGPATRTSAPLLIQRTDWGGAPVAVIDRQTPRGIVLHQIDATIPGNDPLPYLRALLTYQTDVLGWNDMPFHYLIGGDGTLYEGTAGGPTAAVGRLAAGDRAIHVALLGSGFSEQQQDTVTRLLAWLGEAYAIAPGGQHTVEALTPGAAATQRPNIAVHSEFAAVSDPGEAVRAAVGAVRAAAEQRTVRSRWYFGEGNTLSYAERLAVFNPNATAASVRFRLLRSPGPTQERTVTIQPNSRFDLVVNDIFNDTANVPAVVESNVGVIVERYMDFQSDISSAPGTEQAARAWYFAEGSTAAGNKTFLLLFNPQAEDAVAQVTYVQADGSAAEQRDIVIPAQQRTVLTVSDVLPNATFGARVVANLPIIAERTMITGPNSTLEQGGFETAPGIRTLARTWYFAEGTTQAPFQTSLLVLSPNNQRTDVNITFLTSSGTSVSRNYAIPPLGRVAIDVNDVVPDLGVAMTVEATRPVAVERSMRWNSGAAVAVTAGATATAYGWQFADGRTGGTFRTFLLMNNPNANQARVTVTFVRANGTTTQTTVVMAARSRYTLDARALVPDQNAFAVRVDATQPIVVERSIFPNDPASGETRGGTTAIGVPVR